MIGTMQLAYNNTSRSPPDVGYGEQPLDFDSSQVMPMNIVAARIVSRAANEDVLSFRGCKLDMAQPQTVGPHFSSTRSIILDPKTMESEVATVLSSRDKTPVLLKAYTGLGKSTKLPFVVCDFTPGKTGVLVVQPSDMLVHELYSYLRSRGVGMITASTKVWPNTRLTYCSGKALLVASLSGLLPLKEIRVVMLDESHSETAEYDAIRMLTSTPKWGHIRLLLLSATHGGTVDFVRAPGVGFFITKTVSRADYSVGGTEALQKAIDSGDLSPASLRGRVLMFLPNANYCQLAAAWYVQSGVPAITFTEANSYEDYRNVKQFCVGNVSRIAVVCCTAILETGLNVDVEMVVDIGLKEELGYNAEQAVMVRRQRSVTVEEATQRAGRTGRTSSGFYVGPVNHSDSAPPLQLWRTVLWYVVLGFSPPRSMSKYVGVLGCLPRALAAFILAANVHPAILRPYFDEHGRYFVNTHEALSELAEIQELEVGVNFLDFERANWHPVKVMSEPGRNAPVVKIPMKPLTAELLIMVSLTAAAMQSVASFTADARLQAPVELPDGVLLDLVPEGLLSVIPEASTALRDRKRRSKHARERPRAVSPPTDLSSADDSTSRSSIEHVSPVGANPDRRRERYVVLAEKRDTAELHREREAGDVVSRAEIYQIVDAAVARAMEVYREDAGGTRSLQRALDAQKAKNDELRRRLEVRVTEPTPVPPRIEKRGESSRDDATFKRVLTSQEIMALKRSMLSSEMIFTTVDDEQIMPMGMVSCPSVLAEMSRLCWDELCNSRMNITTVEIGRRRHMFIAVCQMFNSVRAEMVLLQARMSAVNTVARGDIWNLTGKKDIRALQARFRTLTGQRQLLDQLIPSWHAHGLKLVLLIPGAPVWYPFIREWLGF